MVPALLIQALKVYSKAKLTKDVIEVLAFKRVDKIGKLITYVGGLPGKSLKFFKKRRDTIRNANISIAKNKQALANLAARARELGPGAKYTNYYKYNANRFLTNIATAEKKKNRFLFNYLKKEVTNKLKSLVPGRRLLLNMKDLAKMIYNKKEWRKIAKKLATIMTKLGSNELSKTLKSVDKMGCLNITANMYWRHISDNKSSTMPLIGPHGACGLLKIQQYKDKLVEKLFDRKFFFIANSPETQNFSQEPHSYDCTTQEYEIPIRGWYGRKVKRYTFKDVPLNTILNTICRRLDAGHNYWNHYATLEAVLWAQIFGSYYGNIKNKK